MNRIGLDVSTVRIGIAVLDEQDNIKHVECLKLNNKTSLEDRADAFGKTLTDIIVAHGPIDDVFIEAPLILYKGGAGQAKTVALLQRFNGMISYAVYALHGAAPISINAASARSKLGIKIVRKRGSNMRERKAPIIKFVHEHYQNTPTPWTYGLTRHGNPNPGVDDEADAIVLAKAGPLLT